MIRSLSNLDSWDLGDVVVMRGGCLNLGLTLVCDLSSACCYRSAVTCYAGVLLLVVWSIHQTTSSVGDTHALRSWLWVVELGAIVLPLYVSWSHQCYNRRASFPRLQYPLLFAEMLTYWSLSDWGTSSRCKWIFSQTAYDLGVLCTRSTKPGLICSSTRKVWWGCGESTVEYASVTASLWIASITLYRWAVLFFQVQALL